MKLTFNIEYHTLEGEGLTVEICGKESSVVTLSSSDNYHWRGSIEIAPSNKNHRIEYRYSVVGEGGVLRREIITIPHGVTLHGAPCAEYIIEDSWRDLPADNYRYSAAFAPAELHRAALMPSHSEGRLITLRALSPALGCDSLCLGVVGSDSSLGGWDIKRAVEMNEVSANLWEVTLPIESGCVEYKFVTINTITSQMQEWQGGDNLSLNLGALPTDALFVAPEVEVLFGAEELRIAGSAIPVFSLRSAGGAGIGDFGDLKSYIEWAAQTSQRAVQILPINDTTAHLTWEDSYPYNAISIYAFHPIYLDLRALPALKSKTAMRLFEQQRKELNALPQVDYERVSALKRNYVASSFKEVGVATIDSAEFKEFFAQNSHWLQPYAAFSFLRDKEKTPDFSRWSEYRRYDKAQIAALCAPSSPAYEAIARSYYTQFLLHTQLHEAAKTARSLGVILKGDIPIGISRESVEAWVEPHYFNMNGQAGAPPDAFSRNGQNWGFPTYNWEEMQKDNYLWWRRRFAKMSEYFTAYRIDHILGFFRIWEIPLHAVHGLLGQFSPAKPMSEEEICGFGLRFRADSMTMPFINDEILDEVFGGRAEYVRKNFVEHLSGNRYSMRKEFATQRAVEAHFGAVSDPESLALMEGLYSLISNVLFVEDRNYKKMYHPRIAAHGDRFFGYLSDEEREAFVRLHDHYYYHRHNFFWYEQALQKLPTLVTSTSMLCCGEDLGMVPASVPPLLELLQILSLEVERMPKSPAQEFADPAAYPFNSVCTIGTHDMATLRLWWGEDRALTQRYYEHALCREGAAPTDATPEICRAVVERHLGSRSMLVILAWQDWLSISGELRNADMEIERINIPANARHYWRWRMHLSIEELKAHKELNAQIAALIAQR